MRRLVIGRDLASFCCFLCLLFVIRLSLLLAHVFAFLGSFLPLFFFICFHLFFRAQAVFFSLFFCFLYLFPNGLINVYASFHVIDFNPKARHRPYASTFWATLRNGKSSRTILNIMRFELMTTSGATESCYSLVHGT